MTSNEFIGKRRMNGRVGESGMKGEKIEERDEMKVEQEGMNRE